MIPVRSRAASASACLFSQPQALLTTATLALALLLTLGDSPNWHLDHIEITNTGTGKTAVFLCQKWLGLGVTMQQVTCAYSLIVPLVQAYSQ